MIYPALKNILRVGYPSSRQELDLIYFYLWTNTRGYREEYRYGAKKIGAQLVQAARSTEYLFHGSFSWGSSLFIKKPKTKSKV